MFDLYLGTCDEVIRNLKFLEKMLFRNVQLQLTQSCGGDIQLNESSYSNLWLSLNAFENKWIVFDP